MRETARILVADDEQDLVWAVQYSLGDAGYEVYAAYDGAEAFSLAQRERPDLVILDISMPRLDGYQVCRRMRQEPSLAAVPILFLSARTSVEDRVTGLDGGGDDYLTKPFDLRELRARVRALLRRTPPSVGQDRGAQGQASALAVGDLALDLQTRRVCVRGQPVQLTPSEFELFYYLMTHPGQLFSSRQLLHKALDYPQAPGDSSVVRWHIKNLRAKLEQDPLDPVYIRTVPRHGYILEESSSVA